MPLLYYSIYGPTQCRVRTSRKIGHTMWSAETCQPCASLQVLGCIMEEVPAPSVTLLGETPKHNSTLVTVKGSKEQLQSTIIAPCHYCTKVWFYPHILFFWCVQIYNAWHKCTVSLTTAICKAGYTLLVYTPLYQEKPKSGMAWLCFSMSEYPNGCIGKTHSVLLYLKAIWLNLMFQWAKASLNKIPVTFHCMPL